MSAERPSGEGKKNDKIRGFTKEELKIAEDAARQGKTNGEIAGLIGARRKKNLSEGVGQSAIKALREQGIELPKRVPKRKTSGPVNTGDLIDWQGRRRSRRGS